MQISTTTCPDDNGAQTAHPFEGIKKKRSLPPKTRGRLFSKPMTGEFRLFEQVEVGKAFKSLATKKAPGPDGILTELLRRTPSLLAHLSSLYNTIFATGHFPCSMLQTYLIFLDKPRKPADHCASKRPVSLMSSLSKALEAVAINRLIGVLEEGLVERQFAYCRERGTFARVNGFQPRHE